MITIHQSYAWGDPLQLESYLMVLELPHSSSNSIPRSINDQ